MNGVRPFVGVALPFEPGGVAGSALKSEGVNGEASAGASKSAIACCVAQYKSRNRLKETDVAKLAISVVAHGVLSSEYICGGVIGAWR
jgi:hypothetical protein